MPLSYGGGPRPRAVDRRASGERQDIGRAGALPALRPPALHRRPPDVGARAAHAVDRVRLALGGRALGRRGAGADARLFLRTSRHRFRLVLEDLRALPDSPLALVEGPQLFPT